MAETYQHGICIEEVSTALQPVRQVSAPIVVIGTAHKGAVNTPVLCQSFTDFRKEFGFVGDFENFTLEEAAYAAFSLYNIAPIICINVLNPSTHKKTGTAELSGTATPFELTGAIILSSVVVKSGSATLQLNKDYTLTQDGSTTTITVIKQTSITGDAISVTYNESDGSKVTNANVIGSGETGLEVLENVYPKLGIVPGTIIAPKFSSTAEVAQAMASKAKLINGIFKTVAICDVTASTYTAANTAKTSSNLIDEHLITCWPRVALGENIYYLSTHAACLMALTDSQNDQIPFVSPSNKILRIDRACLANGTDIYLSKPKANTLNGNGIVTALNFVGWRLWGNRTSIYPNSADVKDNFIPTRRMFDWVGNSLALSFFSRIDNAVNRRLIQSVVDSANIWLNGLTARGAILGGRLEFLEADNPTTDLIDGIVRFKVSICPPTPARVITFTLEYDTNYFSTLFS